MIDVNKAREWWARFGAEVSGSQAQEIAGEYLDEIEMLQKERAAAFLMSKCQCAEGETCANLVRLHTRVNELENSELAKEVEQLRAQLADRRAWDETNRQRTGDGERTMNRREELLRLVCAVEMTLMEPEEGDEERNSTENVVERAAELLSEIDKREPAEVEQPRAKRGHGSPSDPASAFVDADGDRWHFVETPDGWAAVRISTRSKFAAAVSTGGRGPAAGALRAYLNARGIEWRKDGGA